MRKVKVSLTLLLLVAGCISVPVSSSTDQGSLTPTQSFDFFTSTSNGASTLLTKRVGTVMALQTASATPLPTLSPIQTPPPESTLIPTLTPENPILISRINYSGDGVDEITSCLNNWDTYNFVLYQDGRLIIVSKGNYLETVVPISTINKLMSEIQVTGYFALTGDDYQYVESAPTPLPSGWSWGSRITINGKSINLRGDISSDYEVEAIKETKLLIDNLETSDLKPYEPNSVLAYVVSITDPSFDSYDPQPLSPLLHWPREKIQLDILASNFVNFLSGAQLEFLKKQTSTIPTFRMIEQEGKYYLFAVCPNF